MLSLSRAARIRASTVLVLCSPQQPCAAAGRFRRLCARDTHHVTVGSQRQSTRESAQFHFRVGAQALLRNLPHSESLSLKTVQLSDLDFDRRKADFSTRSSTRVAAARRPQCSRGSHTPKPRCCFRRRFHANSMSPSLGMVLPSTHCPAPLPQCPSGWCCFLPSPFGWCCCPSIGAVSPSFWERWFLFCCCETFDTLNCQSDGESDLGHLNQ